MLCKTHEAALRRKSDPVSIRSDRTRQLISDLKDTWLRHPKTTDGTLREAPRMQHPERPTQRKRRARSLELPT